MKDLIDVSVLCNACSFLSIFLSPHLCLLILFFCLALQTGSLTSLMESAWCGPYWKTPVQMFSPMLHGPFVHALRMQRYSIMKHICLLPLSCARATEAHWRYPVNQCSLRSSCGFRRKGLSLWQNRNLLISPCLSPKLSLQPTAA